VKKNNKPLKIVFFGTPEFAVPSLEALLDSPHEVVGVVTVPDKPAGRGRKLRPSAVKRAAMAHGLPLLQPARLKDPAFLEQLRQWDADVFVVVAFRILPREVWQMPPKGTFNLHASLLPDYRGAAPINWVIINGESKTGVTTFFIDDKIDTGEIIAQKEIPVAPDETASSLHDKLMRLGADLVGETVDRIAAGDLQTVPQRHIPTLHPAPKLTPQNTRIDWQREGAFLERFIRGLADYPGAWTYLQVKNQPKKWFIYRARFVPEKHEMPVKTMLLEGKKLKIALKDGWLYPLEVKEEGKKRMKISDYINGIVNNFSNIRLDAEEIDKKS